MRKFQLRGLCHVRHTNVANKMNSSSEITSKITQGAQANKTGNSLEMFVRQTLENNGYTAFTGSKKQLFDNRKIIGGKQYAPQVPVGNSIYESPRKCDFMVFNQEKFPDSLIIECKWQESPGSVDEKYPFLYFNIVKTGVPTIVLIDGDGYRVAAKNWLSSMAHKEKALTNVWTMSEFQKAVNNGFLS